MENRLPGADINPYLALSGDDRRRPARHRQRAAARAAARGQRLRRRTRTRVPHTCTTARDLFAGSEVAREAFGQEVVDHYLNRARVELEASEAAVTDWESSGASSASEDGPTLSPREPARHRHLQRRCEIVRWAAPGRCSCNISPRAYSDAVQAAGGRWRSCCRPTTPSRRIPTAARPDGRRSCSPEGPTWTRRTYGAEPHAETRGTWPERDRFELALAHRALERDMPAARDLPGHADAQRRPRRDARAARARRRGPRGPPGRCRGRSPTTRSGSSRIARRPGGRAGSERRQVAPPPGHR